MVSFFSFAGDFVLFTDFGNYTGIFSEFPLDFTLISSN